MKKQLLLLMLLCSTTLSMLSAQNSKKINELGVTYSPSYTVTDYAVVYKRQLTKVTYAFARLDMTSLSFSASNYDTTAKSKSTNFGGTIGLEFRHNRKNKSLDNSKHEGNIIDLDNFFFFHGPEVSWGTGSAKTSPNAPKIGHTTMIAGYGIGLMGYMSVGLPNNVGVSLQYIPGYYMTKSYKEGVLITTAKDWRLNHKALYASIVYRFSKKDKTAKK